jgi:uncharacterized OB-fold protein
MSLSGEYLGMKLLVDDADKQNLEFFEFCGRHELRLQRWKKSGLISYPPSTACPWDGTPEYEWVRVDGRGTVMSYIEVHHPIMPAFRDRVPYHVLLVELDTQRGQPSEHEALRLIGNLVTPAGEIVTRKEELAGVGIGSRVRVVFADVGTGFALPQWTLDEQAQQPKPWRYGDPR